MIAKFPELTKLGINHQKEVQTYTDKFEPYSDFNFTSLFCWNVDGSTEISDLNENLVIKLPDYLTGEPVYSLIGDQKIDESLNALLEITRKINLVPELVIEHISKVADLQIEKDRDQFDYIYHIVGQADMSGGHFKVKRNKVSKFFRTYGDDLILKKINFKNEETKQEIIKTFNDWTVNKEKKDDDFHREKKALQQLLDYSPQLHGLVGIQVFIDGTCIGFSINELVQKDFAICHFQKAILDFAHVDVFLSNIVAKELKHYGCKYINWEQDLGIPGLRELKESYLNESFLTKYTIKKATSS